MSSCAAPMRSCGWPAVFRPGGPAAAVAFVQAHREEFGVAPLCRMCGMPVSTFYDRVGRPVSARALADAELAEKIEKRRSGRIRGAVTARPGSTRRCAEARKPAIQARTGTCNEGRVTVQSPSNPDIRF